MQVSSYDEAKRADLARRFADGLAGVDVSDVTVEVTPAGVRLKVRIRTQGAAAAAGVASSLGANLADTAAASAFTGVTVTSAPTVGTQTVSEVVPAAAAEADAGGTSADDIAPGSGEAPGGQAPPSPPAADALASGASQWLSGAGGDGGTAAGTAATIILAVVLCVLLGANVWLFCFGPCRKSERAKLRSKAKAMRSPPTTPSTS